MVDYDYWEKVSHELRDKIREYTDKLHKYEDSSISAIDRGNTNEAIRSVVGMLRYMALVNDYEYLSLSGRLIEIVETYLIKEEST